MTSSNFCIPRREINEEHFGQGVGSRGVVAFNHSGIADSGREAGWKPVSVPAVPVHTTYSAITLVTNSGLRPAWKSLFSRWLGDML
jgi:hypothetical protein